MQKQVSKQSLAIVALSILLAIAVALTATFAAFSSDKAISGTVTFSGNVITTMTLDTTTYTAVTGFTPGTKTSVGSMTIANVTNDAQATALVNALKNITVGLSEASSSATFAVKATSSAAFLTITPKATGLPEGWTKMTQGFKASLAADEDVALEDLYDIAFLIGEVPSDAVTSTATIKVVIYADTVAANVDEDSVTLS